MKLNKKRILSLMLAGTLALTMMAGCGKKTEENIAETNAVVSGTEMAQEALDPETVMLTVGDRTIPAYEMLFVYYSLKTSYEGYAVKDWSAEISEGYTYADALKAEVESQVLNMAFLLSKESEYPVELTEEDYASIEEDVATIKERLPEDIKDFYGFTEENLKKVDEDLTKSSKILNAMLEEAEGKLTDEELASCEYRKIQHILISTMDYVPETEAAEETMESEAAETAEAEAESKEETETADPGKAAYLEEKLKLAKEVAKRAKDGEDFETLASEYTADGGIEYSINAQGQTPDGATMVPEFAEAANALAEGEISDPVETMYGYHIIKCVALSDPDAKETAKDNLCYQKVSDEYTAWCESADPQFSDAWKNYVVMNPVIEPETETEAAAESETSVNESEVQTEAAAETEATAPESVEDESVGAYEDTTSGTID